MPTVTSRVNGLKIHIPADAAGVTQRFATKGGNELVFDQSKLPGKGRSQTQKQRAMVVRSEAPDGDSGGLA